MFSSFPKAFQEADKDPNSYFQHLAELTILSVQLIMEFTKRLPGFATLCKDDQLTLLKVRRSSKIVDALTKFSNEKLISDPIV